VVVCDKAAVPLKLALTAGCRVKDSEPVNAVEAPLTVTIPLKATFELKPLATIFAMPACKSKLAAGGGIGIVLPPPHADKRMAKQKARWVLDAPCMT